MSVPGGGQFDPELSGFVNSYAQPRMDPRFAALTGQPVGSMNDMPSYMRSMMTPSQWGSDFAKYTYTGPTSSSSVFSMTDPAQFIPSWSPTQGNADGWFGSTAFGDVGKFMEPGGAWDASNVEAAINDRIAADGAAVQRGEMPSPGVINFGGSFLSEKPADAALGSPDSTQWAGVNQWDATIWDAANEVYEGTGIWVDPNRIKAHMKIESDGVAGAVQDNPTGNAYGLMQVTANAATAPYLMQLLNTNDWNVVAAELQSNPDFAIFAGTLELAYRYNQYGDWNMASQGYFGFDTQDAANGTTSSQYITTLNDYLVQLTTFTEGGQVYVPEVDEGTQLVPGDMQGGVDASYEGVSLGITSIAKLDSLEWQSQGFGMTGFARENTSTELSLDQRCVAAGNGTGKMYDYAACYGFEGHPGIDLGYARGTAISSPVSGTVEVVGVRPDGTRTYVDNSGAPNSGELMLRLDNGDIIIFGHMAQIDVVPGQRINAGDPLGLSGTQGTGDHLHLEVRVKDPNRDDVYYIADPYQYLGY